MRCDEKETTEEEWEDRDNDFGCFTFHDTWCLGALLCKQLDDDINGLDPRTAPARTYQEVALIAGLIPAHPLSSTAHASSRDRKGDANLTLTDDLCPLISLLTYQSLPWEVSSRLTAIVFAPLPTANFVPETHADVPDALRKLNAWKSSTI